MLNFFKRFMRNNKKEFNIKKPEPTPTLSKDLNIHASLDENKKFLSELLHYPLSNDVQFRNINICINNTFYKGLLISYDGLINNDIINNYILRELMNENNRFNTNDSKSILKNKSIPNLKDIICNSILTDCQVSGVSTFEKVVENILHGDSALFIDGETYALICDTKNIPGRSVTKSEIEMNLKGPAEGFIENFRTNTALIRKFVKDENLIFESVEIGNETTTRCAIAYISTIANDSIVDEVRRRMNGIEIDYLLDSGELEQLIEDKTFIIDPLILSTERPDKVASHLIEGRVAIIVEGSNNVLVVPAIFSDFTHASEDSYLRFPYAEMLRIFRLPAIFLSIFLPGLYISICNFHQEMIPTDLLFAIAGAREKVPFTMLTELLIMEIAFEIIREASIRTPAPMGATIRNCWNINFRASYRFCQYS